jgi:hypothetical protein
MATTYPRRVHDIVVTNWPTVMIAERATRRVAASS